MSTLIPPVTKLTPLVTRILGCNPGMMTLQGTNTYLIGTGHHRVLVDTGEPENPEYVSLLKSVLKQERVQSVSDVIITHWHYDHIGGLDGVLSLPEAKEATVWKKKDDQMDPEGLTFNKLEEGDHLERDGFAIKVMHTPGHTGDHVSLLLTSNNSTDVKGQNLVFAGDCILGEGSSVFQNLRLLLQSLDRLRSLNCDLLLPGHGPEIKDPHKKITEYINHRIRREEQILEALKSESDPQTIIQLVHVIYTNVSPKLLIAAAGNVHHHLTKLMEENRVKSIPCPTSDNVEDTMYYKV